MNNSDVSFRCIPEPADLLHIRDILVSTGFFFDYEIDVAGELLDDCLKKGEKKSGFYFLFAEQNSSVCAFSCYGPTPCTSGSYDLYWIAVHGDKRGKGIGKLLFNETCKKIKQAGGRKIFIETASREQYKPTRNFYITCGCTEEARIADFYDLGDDKVIFSILPGK
ncbi:MAG TPA: N-acetyltransferase [Spirochaetia bacterium]|nr:N-acetyltransferase [Spirochaetia bacterium]